MRRDVSTKWALTSGIVLAALAATGFVAPKGQQESTGGVHVGIRVLRPAVVAGTTEAGGAQVDVDARTGAARVISGGDLLPGGMLERASDLDGLMAQAMTYVSTHEAQLGVRAEDLELNKDAVLIDDDVQFLKFRVKKDGLVVQDAVVDFRFKHGKLLQIVNRTYSEAKADDRGTLANLDGAVARQFPVQSAEPTGVEKYRVTEKDGGYALVRVQEFKATGLDGSTYTVQVDAATGDVFEARPTKMFLDGQAQGQVWPRYYKEQAVTVGYRDLKLSAGSSTVTTDAAGKFTGAASGSNPKLNGFTGARINVVPKTGTKVTKDGAASGSQWNINWTRGTAPVNNDKDMAQSMLYFHANKIINYAKGYVTNAWFDRVLTVNANLSQTCNAYWDGSSLNLFSAGGGCANTGLISDVVYHEWGHGLDENSGGIDDGAYSEGFGDIVSLTQTHDNVLGIGFMDNGQPVRDLTTLKVYPRDSGTEVHSEGLIIGGTFWDLWLNLKAERGEAQAADLLGKFALKSIYTATNYTDVYDALLVIDNQSEDLRAQGPNFCSINKAFARHGLATADSSCH